MLCLVTQSCPTLCDPMDCGPPGSSVHEDSPVKNSRVGCHALLQGIFPTQGSNSVLPHCRQILYHQGKNFLSHQGSPSCTREKKIFFSLMYCGPHQATKCQYGKKYLVWLVYLLLFDPMVGLVSFSYYKVI